MCVVPACFKWSDVGNLDQFFLIRHEITKPNNVIAHESSNNLVETSHKLVVLIDAHDFCVLEADDILLISRRTQTDKVKDVLEYLKKHGYEKYI